MTTIAVIGLGVMGRPMAHNLLAAGYPVRVHNRSRPAVDELQAAGATACASAAEAASGADVTISILPDSPDVEAVAFGDDGVLAGAQRGSLFIDMSTVKPATALAVAERASELGIDFLDAPVSGGEQGAVEGVLSMMVGGESVAFERARPILDTLGSTVILVGPHGAGQTVKAANQLLVAGTIELVSEAIVLLEAAGVETGPAVEVLAGGLAGNRILERKAAGMLARDFAPGFRIDLHHKDLQIALATAERLKVSLPVTGLVAQFVQALRANGRGDLDHSALLTLIEDLSGRDG